ncbi:MAG: immunoglobulin domain-containing protein [Verrucomicrobia bacterium]|nr:immunoglobulin domain-containing protein [Verrucomicrobiota bacterium]
MESGIVRYYDQRNGNPAGIPIVHIGINLQPNQDAQTENFIRQAGFKIVADDFDRTVASRFQSSGQPIFVVINGVANSPSHKQWELLVNQNGYGTTQHPIESFRAAIDQVQLPAAPPPMEIPSAPTVVVTPERQTVKAGASVLFSATATGSEPLEFQWEFNDLPIPDATNQTFKISSAQPANAGTYRVLVSNDLGSSTSVAATLTVLVPVAISVQPQDQRATAGSTITLTVEATGTPPVVYQWKKDGVPIPGATSAALVLERVTPIQSGGYSVQVSNALNSVISRMASVIVDVPPTVPPKLLDLRRTADGAVEFALEGEPGRSYEVEFSSDLKIWFLLASVTPSGPTERIKDSSAPSSGERFYRARSAAASGR